MEITGYLKSSLKFFQNQVWLLYTLFVLGIAIALTYIVHIVYQKLNPKLIKGDHFIIQALIQAIYWPLTIVIWIEAVAVNANVFIPQVDTSIIALVEKIREISLIILLAWVFVRFIKLFEEQLLQGRLSKGRTDETTIQATGKLLRVAAFIIVTLLILPVIGVEVTGIVAFASGSVIIVGIAAQHIIANYFGGIVVHSDSHFKVGDWIYSPDRELEGIVEYIGWRSTQIRTFDRRVLYVPNATFSSIILINASRMTNRRIKAIIHIRYTNAGVVEKIVMQVRAMLQSHPGLDLGKPTIAHFAEFGPFAIKIMVYAFTKTTDWLAYCDVQQG
ncbi:MAG: mechanosensitive ion channel family protein, partial [Bacteroidota bacterium]